jgi:ribonuclease HI
MFSQSSFLQFYTDGSFTTNTHHDTTMGFAWIQTNPASQNLAFQASTTKWPSAYKAELMAVLSAIIICPHGCIVDIFTDCQTIINKSQEIANHRYANRRNILKDSHSYLWCIIYESIILMRLTVVSGKSLNTYCATFCCAKLLCHVDLICIIYIIYVIFVTFMIYIICINYYIYYIYFFSYIYHIYYTYYYFLLFSIILFV